MFVALLKLLCILQNYVRIYPIKAFFVSFFFTIQKCRKRIQALEKADVDEQKKEKIKKIIQKE